MATGDQTDFLNRLKNNLPPWFGSSAPLLDGVMSSFAWCASFVYGLIQYTKNQTRIATASDDFLDLLSADLFGVKLIRTQSETDANFRARIIANLFRERGTRKALKDILTAITGRIPKIFESWNPMDTGGYNIGGVGYGVGGAYGAFGLTGLNNQAFVTVYRSVTWGIPYAAGYGNPQGGYGVGNKEYGSLANITSQVTDSALYDAVENVRPIGNIIWVQIVN